MVTHSSNIISFPNDNCDSTNLLNKEQLNSLCGAKLIKNECDASTDPSLKCLPFSSLPPGSRVIEPGQMVTMVYLIIN